MQQSVQPLAEDDFGISVAIVTKYAQRDKRVEIVGVNEYTTAFHSRLSGGLGARH